MKKELRVAIIGHNFMGKAHSNAWLQVSKFFDPQLRPVLQVACGRDAPAVRAFAQRWGWQHVETDWRRVIARDDVDVIDIAVPTHLHHDIAVAAARAGKHLFCEKPMALTAAEAENMLAVARSAGVRHYLNHNYRRCPAVQLARRLIDEGRIGRLFHWRGAYQQDWIVDPDFPLTWQLQKETAGSGPHADLNSHSVDLAHFLVGDIRTVSCLTANFVRERPLPGQGATAFSSGLGVVTQKGAVTVEPNYAALAVPDQTWLSLTNPSGQPITTYYLRAGFALAADPADLLSVNATTGAGFAFTRYATALPVSAEVPVVVLGLAPFGSNFALSWPALAGQTGQPEMWATTNLATGPWLPFTGPLTTNFLMVTNATGQQFFRLKMP